MAIEWTGDKYQQSQRCYEFLFEEFKRFYLSYMFPNAFLQHTASARNSTSTSLNLSNQSNQSLNVYSYVDLIALVKEQPLPSFERPILISMSNVTSNDERKLTQLHCKEEIIKWLIGVLLIDSSPMSPQNATGASLNSSGLGSSVQSDQYSVSSSAIGSLIANFEQNSVVSSRNANTDMDTL
jgi:hypothetical protein